MVTTTSPIIWRSPIATRLIFLSGIPQMTAENGAEARRFSWLIDVLYDNHVKLVASFESALDELYETGRHDSEAQRIASRLTEMQTRRYLELPHHSRGVTLTGHLVAQS